MSLPILRSKSHISFDTVLFLVDVLDCLETQRECFRSIHQVHQFGLDIILRGRGHLMLRLDTDQTVQ